MSGGTGRRLATGGRIDRGRPLSVRFDGRPLAAFAGDTLASALLASGLDVVARSFKLHRPRGVLAAGVEEPSALVRLGRGARAEPNTRATTTEAFDGLEAFGQNAWPSVRYDLGAIRRLFAPLLGAGFYYETFIGPGRGVGFWMFCERFIRRAAGMGEAPREPDPDLYETVHLHADVLVIGSGPAGLSAALAAGRAGARVLLCEQDFAFGGALLDEAPGSQPDDWLALVLGELESLPTVSLLRRATVFGAYDGGVFGVVERVADHVAAPPAGTPRQRLLIVRARRAVLAAGALPQPLVFPGNDLPGVLLAAAVRSYLGRYAVLPGRRALVATGDDSAYDTAAALARAGASVVLADAREAPPDGLAAALRALGVEVRPGRIVVRASGGPRVEAGALAPPGAGGGPGRAAERIACDLLAVSGGFAPTIALWTQTGQRPTFDASLGAFLAGVGGPEAPLLAGGCRGDLDLPASVQDGFRAGLAAARATGVEGRAGALPPPPQDPWAGRWSRRTTVAQVGGKGAFVDLQHDVTTVDVALAWREGYVSVEHAKRYTTAGMAPDQGKTGNLALIRALAGFEERDPGAVGVPTGRPPWVPVAIGALAGSGIGRRFRRTRLSPLHDAHLARGAGFVEAGLWLRASHYPMPGEDLRRAGLREAAQVRSAAGLTDISTLGKIVVQGPDAATFLDRVYVNVMGSLPVGRARYGVMLRDDGFVLDDGTVARLGPDRFFVTTTTVHAEKVLHHLDRLLETAWPELRVDLCDVTEQWAAMALAGPAVRPILAAASGADLSEAAFPANAVRPIVVGGVGARAHRMSFSGETGFEIFAPSAVARTVWDALSAVGAAHGLRPYGTEAMAVLRIEAGHVAGPEIDGRTTLGDLGLECLARRDTGFVGAALRRRPALLDPDRPTLVGLEGEPGAEITGGMLLYAEDGPLRGEPPGWVSSATWSPALGRPIALAFLRRGPARVGERVRVADLLSGSVARATVVRPDFLSRREQPAQRGHRG
ncbi:2Fe-2S iron-sulfur cluster-binding protein [Elioraea sp.]|uniref:2Fe-2S iron-sulfur cluster-binding protein n=1 Tax=Elioraea sp. TaxID=2185103 RepID=UPI00307DBB2D